jgi:hypothetical protein
MFPVRLANDVKFTRTLENLLDQHDASLSSFERFAGF